jgi:hypothetical protein
MALWYTQYVFKGDTCLGEGLADFALVEGVASLELSLNGHERYTLVIVSGYALYGQLRGYYALGVAHVLVDPANGQARYLSEQSAQRQEPVGVRRGLCELRVRFGLGVLLAPGHGAEAELGKLQGTTGDGVSFHDCLQR